MSRITDKKLSAGLFSEGSEGLKNTLLYLWNKGYATTGCCSGLFEAHREKEKIRGLNNIKSSGGSGYLSLDITDLTFDKVVKLMHAIDETGFSLAFNADEGRKHLLAFLPSRSSVISKDGFDKATHQSWAKLSASLRQILPRAVSQTHRNQFCYAKLITALDLSRYPYRAALEFCKGIVLKSPMPAVFSYKTDSSVGFLTVALNEKLVDEVEKQLPMLS